MEFYIIALLLFALALAVQSVICFRCQMPLLRAFPLIINLATIFYAEARLFGFISYKSDTTGIFEGGLVDGIFLSIYAIAALLGIFLAWAIFYIVKWHQKNQ